ncbi:uncharacterized protein LOC120832500 isoform X2 [Gasterosteus aculeatus]
MLTESEWISGLTFSQLACVRGERYRGHRASQLIHEADGTRRKRPTGKPDQGTMLDPESQWSEALASNNIRAIIRWLRRLTAEGEAHVKETQLTFIIWVQRTSELAKKELLTLCLSCSQGLWMFLDRSSFHMVHTLLQRLSNLLTLAQWARRQRGSAHIWHVMGVPCTVCRDSFRSSENGHGCWSREHGALKQHIWLGRLVQWWAIMGLLPKYPDAHGLKHITQMWKEMDHSHRKSLETPGSLIQGMVTQLDGQRGCIWTSEESTEPCYPPPNLQALLKLVLVPHMDHKSVQAILMYFVLDMANFLQCKDDLLRSFCLAFTISRNFSQQIRAFWMLDRGHVKASMELLLSPGAAAPSLPWQHRCIIRCLLTRKRPQLALRYLRWIGPALESTEDAKLCTDVLLQNSRVSEAWALLRRSNVERDHMVMYFLQACNGLGLCAQALKVIPAPYNDEGDIKNETAKSQLALMKKGTAPCPLSAKLYQAHRVTTVSPEDLVQLVRKAVIGVRQPPSKISEVVWPHPSARQSNSRETFLSTPVLRLLTKDDAERAPRADEPRDEKPVHNQRPRAPEHISSSSGDLGCESVPVITSASCSPPSTQDHPYVYQRTLTLQRISSFLSEGENQHGEEEEENAEEVEEEGSRTPSSADALSDCTEKTVTLDGATHPISVIDKDIEIELGLPAEEKMVRCKGEEIIVSPPDVTDLRSAATSLNQEEQSACIPSHSFRFTFSQGLSCATSRTTQNLPTGPHLSPLAEDPVARSSKVSAGTGQQDVSLLSSTVTPNLTPNLTCSVITTSAPAGTASETPPKAQLKMDEPRAGHTVAPLSHGRVGRWRKRDLETCRASSGLPPAPAPGATIASDSWRPSLVTCQPYSCSLVNFGDFSVKLSGDSREGKKADKEEPAGCHGAVRSGRKGKRGKRA